MIQMAKQHSPPDTPDVCIVGAGPAGLTAASLLGDTGRRVILLDSGPTGRSRDAQTLNDGAHVGAPYAGLMRTRHRRVGGTVNIWDVVVNGRPGAKYVPLAPRDLARWPIDWGELRRWYVDAQAVCGLGPFAYDAAFWASPERTPFGLTGTGLGSAVYQFGYAGRFVDTITSRLRLSANAELRPSTTVVGLDPDPSGHHLRGVEVVDRDGQRSLIRARCFVLACGAVENARLLLLAGIGNPQWIGRGFMEHARDFSSVLVPRSPDLFDAAGFYDLHRTRDGSLVGGRLTIDDATLDQNDLPNASATLVAMRSRPGARSRLLKRIPGRVKRLFGLNRQRRYGWSDVASPGRRFDTFQLILNMEQVADPNNRIELDTHCDRFGNRLPRLVLDWSEPEQQQLDRLRELLREGFRAANLGQLLTRDGQPPNLSAHHHAGTTRMAADPDDGVVDRNSRVFGVDNLFVAGASVFPGAGFANPTLTIVALACRLARHIDESLLLGRTE